MEEIEKSGFVLTPGRYVATEILTLNDISFEEKIKTQKKQLFGLKVKSDDLYADLLKKLELVSGE